MYVTLWGTWCPPCISEIPTLVALQERHRDEGLIVVGIAFEREDAETRRTKLRKFVEKRGINYLVLDGGAIEEFEASLPMVKKVKGLPVEILIDRSGRVRAASHGYGYGRRRAESLEKEILELISQEDGAH